MKEKNVGHREWLFAFFALCILSGVSVVSAWTGPSTNPPNNNVSPTAINPWVISGSNLYYTTGNVGVGTTSPSYPLHVYSPTNPDLIRVDGSGMPTNYRATIDFAPNGHAWELGARGSAGNPNNAFYLYDNTATQYRLVVDPSGNIGIGTTSPSALLHVEEGAYGWPVVKLTSANSFATLGMRGNSGLASLIMHFGGTDSPGGPTNELRFGRYSNNFSTWQANPIRFNIGAPDSSLVLDGSGNLSVSGLVNVYPGTGGNVRLSPGAANQTGYVAWYKSDNATRMAYMGWDPSNLTLKLENNSSFYVYGSGSGQVTETISSPGGSYNTDWPAGWGGGIQTWDVLVASIRYSGLQARSDARLKHDIQYMTSTSSLATILSLKPASFYWNDPHTDGNYKQYGFIAQDMQKTFPDIVRVGTDASSTLSLSYTSLIAPLVGSVQELKQENDDLRTQINDIKGEFEAYKAAHQ